MRTEPWLLVVSGQMLQAGGGTSVATEPRNGGSRGWQGRGRGMLSPEPDCTCQGLPVHQVRKGVLSWPLCPTINPVLIMAPDEEAPILP